MGEGGGGAARGAGSGGSKKAKGREAYLAKRAAKESRRVGGVNQLFRVGGGGVALAALASFLYLVAFGALTETIAEFDVASDAFRAALTSGEPWLVLCHNGTGARDQTFVDSQQSLSGIAKLGVVDCATQGPSGNTVMQALGLRGYPPPVAFVTGNGRRPKQVPYKAFKSIKRLASWVTKAARPRILRVKSDKDVQRCHSRKACVLMLSPVAPLRPQQRAELLALAQAHRTTQFAVMHSRRYTLHGDDLDLVATGLGATQVVAGTGAGGSRDRQLEPAAEALLDGVVVFRRVNTSVVAKADSAGAGDATTTSTDTGSENELRARFARSLADAAAALVEPAGDGAAWGVKLSTPVSVERLAGRTADGDGDDDGDADDVDSDGQGTKGGRKRGRAQRSKKKNGGAKPRSGKRRKRRAGAERTKRPRQKGGTDEARRDSDVDDSSDDAAVRTGDSARARKAARRKRRADRVRQYNRATGRGAERVARDGAEADKDDYDDVVDAGDRDEREPSDMFNDDDASDEAEPRDPAAEAALARERERARRQAMEEELRANVPHAADPDDWEDGEEDGDDDDDDWGDVDEEIVL